MKKRGCNSEGGVVNVQEAFFWGGLFRRAHSGWPHDSLGTGLAHGRDRTGRLAGSVLGFQAPNNRTGTQKKTSSAASDAMYGGSFSAVQNSRGIGSHTVPDSCGKRLAGKKIL